MASGSSCRPTTRPTTSGRSCRRHPGRPAGRRRSSSSTTARPTGPAGWPTSWPPRTRGSGSCHRAAKQGLGRAYLDGFAHRPRRRGGDRRPDGRRLQPRSGRAARASSARSSTAPADLVIGSRYTPGGGVVDWGLGRRVVSRGGSLFARIVLGLRPNDLTGGFKAWRAGDAGRRPVRRRPRRRLRLPDRDDLPGQPRGRAHPGGPDHLPGPAHRPVEDEPPDRRRGARRGRPAPGRGAARPARFAVAAS